MRVDASGRVVGFLEKPQTERELNDVAMDPPGSTPAASRATAAIAWPAWAFTCSTATRWSTALEKTNYHDFGNEVFPATIRSRHVQVHLFDGYWEDIGTIRSFYDANLRLAQPNPPFELSVGHGADLHARPFAAADAGRRRDDRSTAWSPTAA